MNHTMIAGRLGADPEVRFTSGGQKVTTFRVATNRKKKGVEETVWYRITVWGELFDKMISYLKKGSAVMVWGDLSAELYTDRKGQQQISLNLTASQISFSPFGKGDSQQQGQSNQSSQANASAHNDYDFTAPMSGQATSFGSSPSDDEIPF